MIACSTTDKPDTAVGESPSTATKNSPAVGLGSSPSGSSDSSGSSASVPSGWETYASTDGGFSIAMPGTPKLESRPVALPNGQSVPLKLAGLDKGSLAYFVGHIDYPPGLISPDSDPQELLSSSIEGATQEFGGGAGLTQKETSVNGVPCRAFNTSGKVDNQDALMEGVFCYENNRLYEVLILGEKNNEFPGLAKQFISSFKITKS